MLGKIDPNELLRGLTDSVMAGKEELVYNFIIPQSSPREDVEIRPSSISANLKGYFTEEVKFLNKGVVGKNNTTTSSMAVGFMLDDYILTKSIQVPLSELPKFSGENLFFDVTRFMNMNFSILAKKHIAKAAVDNDESYMAPKKVVKHIEEYSGRVSLSDDLEKKFIALNTKLHALQTVSVVSSHVVNEMSFEIFVDSDGSEIVQYFDDLTIAFEIYFINLNHASVEVSFVERFKSLDDLPDTFFDDMYKKILYEMKRREKFTTIKSGTYTVKLHPNATNVFIHEGVTAHILSADYIVNGESTIFNDRLGHKYESLNGVHFIMDPTIEGAYGSIKYDCEGVECKKVVMVEDGEIKKYLTGRYSAAQLEMMELDDTMIKQLMLSKYNTFDILSKYVDEKYMSMKFDSDYEKFYSLLNSHLLYEFIEDADDVDSNLDWRTNHDALKKESNGHARVQSWLSINSDGQYYGVVPESRMTNLVIETDYDTSADLTKEMNELAQELDDEFYLEVEAYSGEVDPKTGAFTIYPHFVNKVSVKDGTKESVIPGTLSIHLEDFINHIYLVGSHNSYETGVCGAGSGFVNVGSFTPYMIVRNVPYQAAQKIEQVSEEYYDALQFKNRMIKEKGGK